MILELASFDYLTASPARLVATAPLWEALPRLARGAPVARLLLVADTIRKEDILERFRQAATEEANLPASVLAYRMSYEDYVNTIAQAVRFIRAYLVLDSHLPEDAVIGLLGAYGVQATPLDHELPRPFVSGLDRWDSLHADDGRHLALLASRFNQYGAVLHPRLLHRLLSQDFPLWIALQAYTFPHRETISLLRSKRAMARFGAVGYDALQEAHDTDSAITDLREAILRGEALHAFRLFVAVDAPDVQTLNARCEIVRGAAGLEMERLYGAGSLMATLFSGAAFVPGYKDGAPVTTSGMAILAGSALSYRRRTETRGVMLGIDRNQSPVILDLFDDGAPSYNSVVLGQTGAGKTFAALMLMMRHLMLGTRLIIVDPQGNIDLSFLGEDIYQRVPVGTSAASVNVLDVVQEELGSQVEMATAMLRLLGVHSDRQLERAVLDEALTALYAPIYYERKQSQSPFISDLQAWLEKRPASSPQMRDVVDALVLALRAYTSGSRVGMFGPTNIDFRLDKAVNVFDVSNLPQQGLGGNLRAALLSILVANVNQGIRARRRAGDRAPILFFVDEIGVLIRDPVVANYISSEYKTARARLVGMIVADQDLHSLLGPRDERGLHHGVPMLANSANVFLFNQKESELERVREHFPTLPPSMVDMLPILPRGACLASFPDDLLMINFVPSGFERVVFSSRLQDRQRAYEIVARLKSELSEVNV